GPRHHCNGRRGTFQKARFCRKNIPYRRAAQRRRSAFDGRRLLIEPILVHPPRNVGAFGTPPGAFGTPAIWPGGRRGPGQNRRGGGHPVRRGIKDLRNCFRRRNLFYEKRNCSPFGCVSTFPFTFHLTDRYDTWQQKNIKDTGRLSGSSHPRKKKRSARCAKKAQPERKSHKNFTCIKGRST